MTKSLEFYSVREVATMFDLTVQTIYNKIKNKEIKAIKVAGNIRISKEEIEKILEGVN